MFNDIRHQIDPTVAAASAIFLIVAVGTILALTFIENERK
jgi:ABC-type spermidine/putrescine transport system permease subunit II